MKGRLKMAPCAVLLSHLNSRIVSAIAMTVFFGFILPAYNSFAGNTFFFASGKHKQNSDCHKYFFHRVVFRAKVS